MARKKAPANSEGASEPLGLDDVPSWGLPSTFANAADPRYKEIIESGKARIMEAGFFKV